MIDFSEQGLSQFLDKIDEVNFENAALELFRFQYDNNALFKRFADALGRNKDRVNDIRSIPFLPVSFFKTYQVVSGQLGRYPLVFESSGTTGDIPSRHYIKSEKIYEQALLKGFHEFYGDPADYAIIALLPSYLERGNASLVHMAKVLMDKSGHPANGFYLNEFEKLSGVLQQLEQAQQPTLLLGVTFALLDFATAYPQQLKNTIVMETGGMKGRREEWTRAQVHNFLKQQLGIAFVHSEYGMTELLSQAYAKSDGVFTCSSSMKVLVRDVNDPLEVKKTGSGLINIIDLANIFSCAFIATDDIGNIAPGGSFEVMGRADNAVLRGCNLMVL